MERKKENRHLVNKNISLEAINRYIQGPRCRLGVEGNETKKFLVNSFAPLLDLGL